MAEGKINRNIKNNNNNINKCYLSIFILLFITLILEVGAVNNEEDEAFFFFSKEIWMSIPPNYPLINPFQLQSDNFSSPFNFTAQIINGGNHFGLFSFNVIFFLPFLSIIYVNIIYSYFKIKLTLNYNNTKNNDLLIKLQLKY